MDRPSRRSRRLILASAAAIAASVAIGAAEAPPLRAMRWLAPGAEASKVLTRRPPECLGPALDANTAYEVELGRAAFRSPLLLGGAAARAGIACDTCHVNGRTNPDFDFPGVSGAPGTADVTTAVLSSHRDDGIDNPKPIPDLSGPRSALKVDQVPAGGHLEAFIDGIVTQEFDGAEPPPAVLKGLAAYVRALAPAACPAAQFEPRTAGTDLADARRAVRAGLAALAAGDAASALVMVEAARARLGDVAERYAGAGLAPARQNLSLAGQDLAAAESAIRGDPARGAQALTLWLARAEGWTPGVIAGEARSLYDPSRLAAATAP